MLQVYICDDNALLQQNYKEKLQEIALHNNIGIKITTFSSGEQLVFHLSETPQDADIIFLDIMMGDLNGIDAAKELRNYGCHAEIIFLTNIKEYVFESFDVSPTNYLLKNSLSDNTLQGVFLKAARKAETKSKDFFICESAGIYKQIQIDNIYFFKITNRIISVYYNNESFDFYSSMGKLEEKLSKKVFARMHRSYIVHLKYVDRIEKDTIVLTNGAFIPLGSTYAKDIKLAFSRYLINSL